MTPASPRKIPQPNKYTKTTQELLDKVNESMRDRIARGELVWDESKGYWAMANPDLGVNMIDKIVYVVVEKAYKIATDDKIILATYQKDFAIREADSLQKKTKNLESIVVESIVVDVDERKKTALAKLDEVDRLVLGLPCSYVTTQALTRSSELDDQRRDYEYRGI